MDVSADTAVILERLDTIDDNLNTMNKVITGNGEPEKGMIVRMARFDDYVAACQASQNQSTKTAGRYLLATFAALLGAGLAMAGYWVRSRT